MPDAHGAVAAAALATLALLVAGGASCADRPGATQAPERGAQAGGAGASAEPSRPDLRLAILTDLGGMLEPCGCTSRPLGGVDRLAAQLKALRADGVPLDVLAAGDTFYADLAGHGPPSAAPGAGPPPQDVWKAEVVADILGSLGLARVVPGPHDDALGAAPLEGLTRRATWRGDAPGSTRATVLSVRAPTGESAWDRDAIAAAATAGARAGRRPVVALVTGSRRFAREVATSVPGVDLVIAGGLDVAVPDPPASFGSAYVLNAGRQGQGLLVVELYGVGSAGPFADVSEWTRGARLEAQRARVTEREKELLTWERDPKVLPADLAAQRGRLAELRAELAALERPVRVDGPRFVARWIPLERSLPQDPKVTAQMRAHDRRVNEHNRVAYRDARPPPVPKGSAAYVGSSACATCHGPAHAWWKGTKHGRAYATLEAVDKQWNLSCVGCHVTGYGKPGGATVTHNQDGKLVDVGCESCHGPGSLHALAPTTKGLVVRATPEATCVGCHNKEHSDLFVFAAYRAMLIAPGHGMPAATP